MTATSPDTPSTAPRRRLRRWAGNALVVALVIAWAVLLRPTALGGPASYVLVSGQSMHPGLESGDLAVMRRDDSYVRGDVIAYRIRAGQPGAGGRVIHRVIGGSPAEGLRTQGDNRDQPDIWRPRSPEIEGRLWMRVPKLGALVLMLAGPWPIAAAAGLLTFLSIGGGGPRPGRGRQVPRVAGGIASKNRTSSSGGVGLQKR